MRTKRMTMKRERILTTFLLAALSLASVMALLAACKKKPSGPHCIHTTRRTFEAYLCAPKRVHERDEPIHVTLTLTNLEERTVLLDGDDEPAVDILFPSHLLGTGREQRWSEEQPLTTDLSQLSLVPGETYTITWTWPTPSTSAEQEQLAFEGGEWRLACTSVRSRWFWPPLPEGRSQEMRLWKLALKVCQPNR